MNQAIATNQTQEWYQYLIESCQAILIERGYNAKVERMLCYGEVGERISNDENYQKFIHGNGEFVQKLFSDIGISQSEGYRAIQWYEYAKAKNIKKGFAEWRNFEQMFNNIAGEFPEGKSLSYSIVKSKYLPASSKENESKPHEHDLRVSIKCRKCDYRENLDIKEALEILENYQQ